MGRNEFINPPFHQVRRVFRICWCLTTVVKRTSIDPNQPPADRGFIQQPSQVSHSALGSEASTFPNGPHILNGLKEGIIFQLHFKALPGFSQPFETLERKKFPLLMSQDTLALEIFFARLFVLSASSTAFESD